MLSSSSVSSRCFTARQAAPAIRRTAVVVRVKPTKAADFKALSNEEVLTKIAELKKEEFRLEYLYRSRGVVLNPETKDEQPDADKVPKSHEFKHTRRQIAQLWTLLRERQAADGLDRKAAKKLKKSFMVAAGFGRF